VPLKERPVRIHVTTTDTGAPWGLSLDRFAAGLAAYRPDTAMALDPGNAQPQVRFELALGDHQAEGIYFTGQWNQLICWDATIDDWAPVIEWFLSLLPSDSHAETFLEAVATPRHLPRLATAAHISQILTDLDNSA
jgi:hypothetical protein